MALAEMGGRTPPGRAYTGNRGAIESFADRAVLRAQSKRRARKNL